MFGYSLIKTKVLDSLEIQVCALKSELNASQEEREDLENLLTGALDRIDDLEDRLADLQDQYEQLEHQLDDTDPELFLLTEDDDDV